MFWGYSSPDGTRHFVEIDNVMNIYFSERIDTFTKNKLISERLKSPKQRLEVKQTEDMWSHLIKACWYERYLPTYRLGGVLKTNVGKYFQVWVMHTNRLLPVKNE